LALPEGILQHLMQPMLATLEYWDSDKEDTLKAAIKLQEFEKTNAFIDKLVASEAYNEANRGIFFGGNFKRPPYDMERMCTELYLLFGVSTDEETMYHGF
jgi:hypothetical protein